MAIWTAEIKELEKLNVSLKGQLPDLEKELEHLIKADDENMILLYSRRCLEVIITDLCECELKRPRKTEPLQGIIDKLNKEEKVPSHIIASMHGLNSLSTFGTHPKDFDPEQIKPVLVNLDIIIKWYLKYRKTGTNVKTKSAEQIRQETKSTEDVKKSIQIPKKRLIVILSGLIVFIVIVFAVLFLTNIIGSGKPTKDIEKSIAVLPFKLLSDEPGKQYLADGMMDAITLHLSKIKDLRVMSRTSTEQYRVPGKTMNEIGRELDVKFLLEGSFQKFGDNVRLIVQLIKTGKEGHIWANDYDRNWSDIFAVQSEVAQAVAAELYASITPEEKKLIEKIPTSDTAAYELYLRANDYQKNYEKTRDSSSYQNAVDFYNAALVIDPSFAKAYTGLASAYYDRYQWETYFKENYLDSMQVLIDKALDIDDQLDEAYYFKGRYYYANGQIEEALENYDKALKINPNYYLAYSNKGYILAWIKNDYVKALDSYHNALNLAHGEERSSILFDLGHSYRSIGFMDKAKRYFLEKLTLDGDSADYFNSLGYIEFSVENFENATLFIEKANKIDSAYTGLDWYNFTGQHQKAFMDAEKEVEQAKKSGILPLGILHRIGYAYSKVGKNKEALYYFNEQIKNLTASIKLQRDFASTKRAQYDLAGIYAFLGDKNKAYTYLDEFNTMNFYPSWWLIYVKNDPLFDSIRSEKRFQKIVQNMEAKYQAEHERVRKWLEEQGML